MCIYIYIYIYTHTPSITTISNDNQFLRLHTTIYYILCTVTVH